MALTYVVLARRQLDVKTRRLPLRERSALWGKGMKDEASAESQGRLALLRWDTRAGTRPSSPVVQEAASPWSVCVNGTRAGAQLFLGGIWVL